MKVEPSNLELYIKSLIETLPDTMTPLDVSEVVKIAPNSILSHKSIFPVFKNGGRYTYNKSDIIESISKCYKRIIGTVSL